MNQFARALLLALMVGARWRLDHGYVTDSAAAGRLRALLDRGPR